MVNSIFHIKTKYIGRANGAFYFALILKQTRNKQQNATKHTTDMELSHVPEAPTVKNCSHSFGIVWFVNWKKRFFRIHLVSIAVLLSLVGLSFDRFVLISTKTSECKTHDGTKQQQYNLPKRHKQRNVFKKKTTTKKEEKSMALEARENSTQRVYDNKNNNNNNESYNKKGIAIASHHLKHRHFAR